MPEMRPSFIRALLTCLGALTFAPAAIAGVFELKFPSLGRGRTAEECGALVQSISEQFALNAAAAGTPTEILGSACVPAGFGREGPDGRVSYAAPERVATVTSDVGSAWGIDGHYQSWETCLEGLSAERSMYERVVGLTPFAAFCYQSNIGPAPRFRVRLDAVGTSDIAKRSVEASWVMPLVDPPSVKRAILDRAAAIGLDIVAFTFDRDGPMHRATVDYYARQDHELFLHAAHGLEWRSLVDCETKAIELASRWPVSETTPVFGCSSALENEYILTYLWFSPNIFTEDDIDAKMMPQVYADDSACVADARRIEDALTRAGDRVLASHCGFADNQTDVRLMVFIEVVPPIP